MKIVKKIFPIDIYDIEAAETYLEDMAKQGFIIRKIGIFAHYEVSEPKYLKYRIELIKDRKISPDILAIYNQKGWDYVAKTSRIFCIFVSNREDPTEIHTDPIAQSHIYEDLTKQFKKALWLSLLLLPIVTMMLLFSVFGHPQPLLFAVKYSGFTPIILLISTFLMDFNLFCGYKKLNTTTNQLKNGISFNHKKQYKKRYLPFIISMFGLFLGMYLIISSSVLLLNSNFREDYLISDYTEPLIHLSLSEIEADSNLIIEKNYVGTHKTPLTHEIIEVYEKGDISTKRWDDNSGNYSPSIQTELYDLKFKILAKPLLEDILNGDLEFDQYDGYTYQELYDHPFDRAVLTTSGINTKFYVAHENRVIVINYYGYADLNLHLDELFNKITSSK